MIEVKISLDISYIQTSETKDSCNELNAHQSGENKKLHHILTYGNHLVISFLSEISNSLNCPIS